MLCVLWRRVKARTIQLCRSTDYAVCGASSLHLSAAAARAECNLPHASRRPVRILGGLELEGANSGDRTKVSGKEPQQPRYLFVNPVQRFTSDCHAMSASKSMKDRSLRDMLRLLEALREASLLHKVPITCKNPERQKILSCVLEVLFSSLQEDLQTVKKDPSSDLQKVRCDLDSGRERVAALEDKDAGRSNEIE
ncbi:hypothetical protein NDU88_002062 [Pleurodeles waltl]|uniref:Uncharacterized protein n=1 Tax=Pleurodeles waltl TaxID=8319 RepID=A0AAV7NCX6_PLEWA|nr:hypothetical protein NDU88_002062 [Pleurodeles waltl]